MARQLADGSLYYLETDVLQLPSGKLVANASRQFPGGIVPEYPTQQLPRTPLRGTNPTPYPAPEPTPPAKGGQPGREPPPGAGPPPGGPPTEPVPRVPNVPVVPQPPPAPDGPDPGRAPDPLTPTPLPENFNFSKGQVRPDQMPGDIFNPSLGSWYAQNGFDPFSGAGKGGQPGGGFAPSPYSLGQASQWDPFGIGQGNYGGGPIGQSPGGAQNIYGMTGVNAATGYSGPARYGVVGGQGGYGVGMVGPEYSGPIFDDPKVALKALRKQERRLNRPIQAQSMATPAVATGGGTDVQQKGGQPEAPPGGGTDAQQAPAAKGGQPAPQGPVTAGTMAGGGDPRMPTMAVQGTGGPRMVNGMEVGSPEWMAWAGIKPGQMNAAHGGVAGGAFGAPSNFQSSNPEWANIQSAYSTNGQYYIPQGNEAYRSGNLFLVPASGTDQGLFKDVNTQQVYNWGQQQGGAWGWNPYQQGATPTGQNGMFLRPGEGGSPQAPGRVMQRLF